VAPSKLAKSHTNKIAAQNHAKALRKRGLKNVRIVKNKVQSTTRYYVYY
jgi:hypothetical protein